VLNILNENNIQIYLIVGIKNVEEYWEMLSGYSGGYDKINNEWNRINNLHKKIVKFVGTNLARKYNVIINDTLPAYLLGKLTIVRKNSKHLINFCNFYFLFYCII